MARKKEEAAGFATVDYDNTGFERPYAMTCGTLMVYEAEFGGADMVADVMGKVPIEDADPMVMDFTRDHHVALVKALWAMLYTAADIDGRQFPHYREWVFRQRPVNFEVVQSLVVGQVLEFFPSLSLASQAQED